MILAIDSGGSKTDIRVFELSGEMVFQKILSGYAIAVESDEPIPELEDLVRNLASKYEINAAAFSIGGKNVHQAEATLRRALPGVPISVFRESDGTAALAIGSFYNSELVLLAGTGAIISGINPETGRQTIVGGWGANISDEGSGYSIGLNTLRKCILAMDDTAPLTPMVKAITGRDIPLTAETDTALIRTARDEVRSRMFPIERSHVASFTKTAAQFCAQRDPLALEIFRDAGVALGKLLIQAAGKLDLTHVNGITITGGLVNAREYWQQTMEDTVRERISVGQFHYVPDGLIKGTFEVAKSLVVF